MPKMQESHNYGPRNMQDFYCEFPEFLWGPGLLISVLRFVTNVPAVAKYIAAHNMATYGLADTATFIAFAVMLAFATHGWYATFADQKRQFQDFDAKHSRKPGEKPSAYIDRDPPTAGAIRTVAALVSSIVYAFVPFAPPTTSWPVFIGWTMAVAVYWDLHFFVVHKTVHENAWLYKHIHKLHHSHKQSGPFSAYFVTYQSNFLTEQLVVIIAAALGCPRDVFTWSMYWGTLGTYVEHGGHDLADVRLAPLPVTFAQLSTILSPWSLVLGGESPGMHDWHHEKFFTNYALSFSYLDKLFGTFHPGRVPGEAIGLAHPRAAKKDATPATPAVLEGMASCDAIADVIGSQPAFQPKVWHSAPVWRSVPAPCEALDLDETCTDSE